MTKFHCFKVQYLEEHISGNDSKVFWRQVRVISLDSEGQL